VYKGRRNGNHLPPNYQTALVVGSSRELYIIIKATAGVYMLRATPGVY
jgi:RNA:NAD 2'-phosphotransferase (TPT1/KptA family)